MAVGESVFGVMGSTAHLIVVGDDVAQLLAHAEHRLRRLEARWTRFSEHSELSRLNRQPGRPVRVGSDLLALVARACDGWRVTDGAFDPTVLSAMRAAGYRAPADRSGSTGSDGPAPGCSGIAIDPVAMTVFLPDGVTLDPGGLGKGLAADLVGDELMDRGAGGVSVNVGGDIRVAGASPDPLGWFVRIEDPFDEHACLLDLRIGEGAVATTTPSHRRWSIDGAPGRHVIDPRTGLPSPTDVASVTVMAAQAWMAEVVSKAAALAGFEAAADVIDDHGLSGMAVSDAGDVRLSARLGAFL